MTGCTLIGQTLERQSRLTELAVQFFRKNIGRYQNVSLDYNKTIEKDLKNALGKDEADRDPPYYQWLVQLGSGF